MPYYRCAGCKKINVRKEELDTAFSSHLENLEPRESLLKLFEAVVMDAWKKQQTDTVALVASHEGQLAALREKEDKMTEAFIYEKVIDKATC